MTDDASEIMTTEESEEESFAALFEQSSRQGGGHLTPGQKITGRILKVSAEWVFIDTSHKGEGVIDSKEFLDLDGNMT
ncbi:MAG: 30S ribosomal protein S1, partial [Deltaproteobacteria bacterium]